MTDYSVAPARYAKGKYLVTIQSDRSGIMGRAERLIHRGLNCRFTGRENGFIASASQVRRFEKLYAEGWTACPYKGELHGPNGERIPNRTYRGEWG